jgi:hypothetical protein
MKKDRFLLGILALTLIFGLVLTGCNLNGDEPPTVTAKYTLDDGSVLEVYDDGTVKLIPPGGATGNTKTGTYDKNTGQITFGESADTTNTLTVNGDGTVTGTVDGKDVSGTEDNTSGNGSELEEMFNGTASEMGITGSMTVDQALAAYSEGYFSNLSDFTAAGCEMYINGQKVTNGSTRIRPTDTVRVLVPKGSGGDGDDNRYPDLDDNGGGLEEMFNGRASDMGITEVISADTLFSREGSLEGISNFSDFIKAGGELYINGNKITLGSTMIQPTDTVRIMLPKGFLVSVFNGRASDMGITEAISADTLFSMGDMEGVSYFSDFIKAGCKLYVNNEEVVSGSTMIQPTDTVRIIMPVEFLKFFINGEGGGLSRPDSNDENGDPQRPGDSAAGDDTNFGNAGGSFSGKGLDTSAMAIRNMKRIFTVK